MEMMRSPGQIRGVVKYSWGEPPTMWTREPGGRPAFSGRWKRGLLLSNMGKAEGTLRAGGLGLIWIL